ncbi:MAG: hypothetical protein GF401_08895 [Chitinivibrionales bacterium]|nr:hypothetical protein [Chitinivibrionales bacterium]
MTCRWLMYKEQIKKNSYYLVIYCLAVALAGCAPGPDVSTQMYSQAIDYPATDPETVEVFRKEPKSREFVEIAEIVVDGVREWEQAEKILRIKGAEFGADAVYVYETMVHEQETYPSRCYSRYYYGFGPPHFGGFPGDPYFRYRSYPHHYYYCYGDPAFRTITYTTVVGIAIKYKETQNNNDE